jgi:predicted nucleic acid-binding protein
MPLVKPSVYVETSVISYLTARPSRDVVLAGQQQMTAEWWRRRVPSFDPCISVAVVQEASRGDPEAVARRLQALRGIRVLAITEEIMATARTYSEELALPGRAMADAVHFAVASKYEVDYLVSWNCTHIANARIVKRLLEFNLGEGLFTPIVCTPAELMEP